MQGLFGREPELLHLLELASTPRVIQIAGVAGVGKTTFIRRFQESMEAINLSTEYFDCRSLQEWNTESLSHLINYSPNSILIFDHLELLPDTLSQELIDILQERTYRTNTASIFACRVQDYHYISECHQHQYVVYRLYLRSLELRYINSIFEERLGLLSSDENLQVLMNATEGNPAVANIYTDFLTENKVQPSRLIEVLFNSHIYGTADSNGVPFDTTSSVFQSTIQSVKSAPLILYRQLVDNPELIFQFSPRAFEEFVASVFEEEGYKATLTPITRDGGYDIYLQQHGDFGRLLYLVECKRYDPNNKVSISVVRDLYGVVETEKVNGGFIVTTSSFTSDAIAFAARNGSRMNLIDYLKLSTWLKAIG